MLCRVLGDLRQGGAQCGEVDLFWYQRADIEVEEVADLDRFVANLLARCANDDDRCPALDLRQQLKDLDARILAERKVERDAIEGTLVQQLAGLGDRVGSGGPEAYLLRNLAKDREMEFGVLDDQ